MATSTSAATSATRGLAAEAVGPIRVVAFGTSIVAPAASVVAYLVLVLAFAG